VKSYKRFWFIFKNTLKNIDAFGVQTNEDKRKFAELTDKPIDVTGNLKFALYMQEYDNSANKKSVVSHITFHNNFWQLSSGRRTPCGRAVSFS
jgi:3-deoxy-D-manno-octulosonic-acid transferase